MYRLYSMVSNKFIPFGVDVNIEHEEQMELTFGSHTYCIDDDMLAIIVIRKHISRKSC